MNMLRLIGGLIVLTAVVVFGAQNTQAVTLHFLMFRAPSAPLVLALVIAVVLGVLLGWLVSAPGRFRNMRERHHLQGQVAAQDRAATATMETNRKQPSSAEPLPR